MADNFPLRFLLATFGGWVNRHQAQAIEYLVEENRVLKEQLGNRRLRLTDDQRRRLAAKGKPLGRRMLDMIATIVSPDTILRWHRKLILFGEGHLRRALNEFVAHYHADRPHQGIGNQRITPTTDEAPSGSRVVVDERLGGLLRSYRRSA